MTVFREVRIDDHDVKVTHADYEAPWYSDVCISADAVATTVTIEDLEVKTSVGHAVLSFKGNTLWAGKLKGLENAS